MSNDFQVFGTVADAAFTLKVHRGEGMALLAMNWRTGQPPSDFVGFAIEYREPNGTGFYAVKNRPEFQRRRWPHIEFEAPADLLLTSGANPKIPLGSFSAQRRLSR